MFQREHIASLIEKTRQNISRGTLVIPFMMILALGSFGLGFFAGSTYPKVLGKQSVRQPLPETPDPAQDKPLRKYSIQNLESYDYQLSEINLEKVLDKNDQFTSYVFSYRTLGKKMTGQINIPAASPDKEFPVIVLIRGYVDAEEFRTGMGTSPVAAEFAKAGYVTVAPDFLGFGGSDPAGPGWEERFEKPVNVVELIKSLRQHSSLEFKKSYFNINPKKMGLWAHSNGGQITLTTLEAMGEAIPTAVWAPVTAPFPYSVLFYSDEMEDGGKSMRSAIAGFESVYNVQEYSLTQHLNRLRGPIQLHQGTADDAVPKKWSDEFVKKIKEENERRKFEQDKLTAQLAADEAARKAAVAATASALPSPILPSPSPIVTASASPSTASGAVESSASGSLTKAMILADLPLTSGSLSEVSSSIKVKDVFLEPIELNYFVYKNGNHFMRPGWEEAVARDLKFYDQYLHEK
jgi:alpha-beta hydrolase superfamily lysophospholipase